MMNLNSRGPIRHWDPYGRVRDHLKSIQDKFEIVYQHQTNEEDYFHLYLEKWEELEFIIICTKEALRTSSQTQIEDVKIEEAELKEIDKVIKQKFLRGLSTRLLKV